MPAEPIRVPARKHQPPACAVGAVQSGEKTGLPLLPSSLGHSPASGLPFLAGHALRASSENAGVSV